MDERWKRIVGGICHQLEEGMDLTGAAEDVIEAHTRNLGLERYLWSPKEKQLSDEFYLHLMEGEQDPSSPWAPAAKQIRALEARNEAKRNNQLEARNRELEALTTALKSELVKVYTRGWVRSFLFFVAGLLIPFAIHWLIMLEQ